LGKISEVIERTIVPCLYSKEEGKRILRAQPRKNIYNGICR